MTKNEYCVNLPLLLVSHARMGSKRGRSHQHHFMTPTCGRLLRNLLPPCYYTVFHFIPEKLESFPIRI